jgi:hypothetical protein
VAQKLQGTMPQEMDLEFTYTIEFAAVDPTTGANVAGVVISGGMLLVDQLTPGGADALAAGPFMLVPGPAA